MRIPQPLKKYIKPIALKYGLYWPIYKERRAFLTARLDVASRLRGKPGRLAILGCGAMGTTIARSISLLNDWSVNTAFDPKKEALDRFAKIVPGVGVADSMEEFFEQAKSADVVVIATTADAHISSTLQALEHGIKTILLEKPVTTSLEDADTLIEAAKKYGARVAVDHTRRWLTSGTGLKRLLDSGVLGEVRAMHFVYGRAGFAMIGTHLFDLARWLTGSELIRLRAELDPNPGTNKRGKQFVDPPGYCEGRFANGARLTMDLSSDLHLRQRMFTVICERGRVEVDERLSWVRLVGTGNRVWEGEYISPDALQFGVATALHDLQQGGPPAATLEDGRAALEAAIACQVSHREEARWVELPLAGDIRKERFPFA